MPMPCVTCGHPHRSQIEAAIVSGRSIREVARAYDLDRSALEVAFVDNDETLFPSDVIAAAMTPEVRPLFATSPFASFAGGHDLAS